MIRVLVKDLLLIATGEQSADQFISLLNGAGRPKPVQVAPAQGLFLTGVEYPYLSRSPDLPICGQIDWQLIS